MAVASEQSQKIFRVGFGVADLVSAVLVYVGVFEGLPSRYGPVDAAAAGVIALFAGGGGGLLGQTSWAPKVAWMASAVSVPLGRFVGSTLALTRQYLSRIYGPGGPVWGV